VRKLSERRSSSRVWLPVLTGFISAVKAAEDRRGSAAVTICPWNLSK